MLGFYAWYTEGRLFRGVNYDDWVPLPKEGLLGVVVFRKTGKTPYDGADWTWFDGREWGFVPSVSWDGTYEPKPALPCSSCIKRGDAVSDDEYEKVALEMQVAWWQ